MAKLPLSDIIVCYAATPDTTTYPEYVSRSAYSLARSNPGIRSQVIELEGGEYPYNIIPECIPADEPADKWVIVLDADTWIDGDIRQVLPGEGEDISLRVENQWAIGKLNKRDWRAICRHFGIGKCPVYCNGVMACRGDVAAILHRDLVPFTKAILEQGALGRIPDPLRLKHRPAWWMSDQFALSILVAERKWDVRRLGQPEFSWNFTNEDRGIVHHLGKVRNPLDKKRWKNFRQKGKGDE